MSDPLAWRLGARVPDRDYRVFQTAFVDGEHPRTGAHKRFSLIEAVDWVNVIALTPDHRVVLIKQFRVGSQSVCLEIPGGMVDPGETPRAGCCARARRGDRLHERALGRLGDVSPNPAIMTNRLRWFLAHDATPTHAAHPDGGEVLDVFTLPLFDIQTKLRSGELDHALVVAAFGLLALEMYELKRPEPRG